MINNVTAVSVEETVMPDKLVIQADYSSFDQDNS